MANYWINKIYMLLLGFAWREPSNGQLMDK